MDKEEGGISRRSVIAGAVAAAAVACKRTPAAQALDHVEAQRVAALPKGDPTAAAWNDAQEYEGALAPQNITPPMLREPSVSRVKVRALHDGTWVAFRLEWTDSAEDGLLGPSRFSDAAAVQVQRDRGPTPSPMMGHPGAAVRILLWKAAWQTADMVSALHPNRPPPFYPFEAATPEHRERMTAQYAPANNVHNPNFHRPGGGAVILAEAEQFGTLTGIPVNELAGRGVYANRTWRVVLASPMEALGNAVRPGSESNVAFALWEGSSKNVGSRKMRSEQWVRLVMR